jgi:hypothetical protein
MRVRERSGQADKPHWPIHAFRDEAHARDDRFEHCTAIGAQEMNLVDDHKADHAHVAA